MSNDDRFIYDIISSANKEEGWKRYLAELDTLKSLKMPTTDELRFLHKTIISQSDLLEIEGAIKDELINALYILDRKDAYEKQKEMELKMPYSMRLRRRLNYYEDPQAAFQILQSLCENDTIICLDPKLRGEIRSYGTRRINDAEIETVFASHQTIYAENDERENMMRTGIVQSPQAYYGLSIGLDQVYQALCNKYDTIISEQQNLDGILFAEAFLQVAGTRIVHPFWDGNGRTFGVHLAKTLDTNGIKMREYDLQLQFFPAMTTIVDMFLRDHFLPSAGLGLIEGEYHTAISIDFSFRNRYMTQLRTAIDSLISDGINLEGKFFDVISNQAWQIKRVLIEQGLLKAGLQEEKRLRFENEKLSELPEEERVGKVIFIPHRYLGEL